MKILAEKGDVENAGTISKQITNGANYDFTMKGIQVGFDFYEKLDDNEEVLRVSGFYFTYANMKNDLYSSLGQKLRRSSLDANSLSYYYTTTNKDDHYFDFVAQYTRYSNVKGDSAVYGHNFGTKGWAALVSGEVGYPYYMDDPKEWNLEPQAQLIYQYTDLDASTDREYRYAPDTTGTFTGRLGARLAYHTLDKEQHPFDAFIRANYWHTFDKRVTTRVSTLDGQFDGSVETELGARKLQFGLGMTYEPDFDWQIFMGIDYNK